MAEIETTVPEITAADEPLLSTTETSFSSMSGGGSRISLLSRLASRRGASQIVRENVAVEMENRQDDWSYSYPVVLIDAQWNLAFVIFALVMLFWIAREDKDVKLRVWICGYATQCVVHVVLLVVEYKRRNRRIANTISLTSSSSSSEDGGENVNQIRRLEWLNTMISYMWWVIGLICLLYSYDNHGAPHLFWLTLAFLAIDMFFLVIRSIIVCLLSAGYFFCLPHIIAFMYYISGQERQASYADISRLPKYIFEVENGDNSDVEQPDVRACSMIPMRRNDPDFSTERVIPSDEADCCICLCHYEDGQQLHLLPCSHHFHSSCIVKWLRVKATCPLCKSLAV